MMRFNRRELLMHSATAGVVVFGLSGLFLLNARIPWVALVIPWSLGIAYVLFRMRRYLRRLRAGSEPSPGVREALERKVHFYQRLEEAQQARFRRDIHYFLLDHHIQGVKGVEVTDELRALVAASAVVLTFGRPAYEWNNTRDILLYPDAFDENYEVGSKKTRLGQVGLQSSVIFSVKALRQGFARSSDGHNVGFHEFAHVLDCDDGEIDGLPANLNWQAIQPWLSQMDHHMKRFDKRRGRRKQVLRDYGYTNEAEFFACATEMFFEQPGLLERRAPELYGLMVDFYGQDFLENKKKTRKPRRSR